MENILHKFILLFNLLLFTFGYGQNCFTTDINRIISNQYYQNVSTELLSLSPSGTISENINNLINGNLTNYYSLQSTLPVNNGSITNPDYVSGTINATFAINNLDIKANEGFHIEVGEFNRFGGISGLTASSVNYSVRAYKNNNPVNNLVITNTLTSLTDDRRGTISFIAPQDIDRVEIEVNGIKQYNRVLTNSTQSRLNIRFYGLYVNPLTCQPTPCNTSIPLTKEYYGESLTSGGSSLISPYGNLINSDTSDGVTLALLDTAWVKKSTPFAVNSYVGFNIDEGAVLSLGSRFIITTYFGGSQQESRTFDNAGISLITGGNRQIGFQTSQSFDQVEITVIALTLGGVTVKNAFVLEPCSTTYDFSCNVNTSFTQDNFATIINNDRSGNSALLTAGSLFMNPENVVDNNPDNFARIFAAAGPLSTTSLAVKSVGQSIPGGYFAGFLVENSSLVDLDLLNNITIRTYRNNAPLESATGAALGLNLRLLPGTNRRIIGFNTTQDFDEIVFETQSTLSVSIGVTDIYEAIVRENCFGPDPTCNTNTRVALPDYPVSISPRTGISGLGVTGSINNADNVLNNDPDLYATIDIDVAAVGNASLAVDTGNQIFNGGTFAGFEVQSASLLDVDLLNQVSIITYLNGEEQERSNSGNILVDIGAIGVSPKAIVGFETTLPFNEVEFNMSLLVSLNLFGETRVYNLILKRFCEPDVPLACNELRTLKEDEFPVTAYSTVSSLANVSLIGDLVQNLGNLLDNDTDNAVTLNPTVTALTQLTIGVNKAGVAFKPGTYAEFEVQSTNLINASLLDNFSVRLLNKAGNVVQTINSSGLLLGVGLFEFGAQQTQKIGFKSNVEFNKAELIYNIPEGITLGVTQIYRFNVMETCPLELDCEDTDPITNVDRPVIINALNTTVGGLVCLECDVYNPENLIDGDLTNSTSLVVGAGVAARTAISVKDLANVYPAGSFIGFTTTDANPVLNLDLLNLLRVTTYYQGTPIESASGLQLLNLNALFLQIFPQNNVYGFRASSKFDEVQISLGSLASVINVVEISSLAINLSGANDPDIEILCPLDICVKPGNFIADDFRGSPSITGISTLQNQIPTWTTEIRNGFIALESKNKGLVITRVPNSESILNPVEGMIIYDINAACIKLYNGDNWNCIEQSCNE